jgi:RimJ/RimL family protein N-acetyltransferase
VHSNAASMSVLRKAGFNCEAVFKSNIFLRGRFYDEYIYAKYS